MKPDTYKICITEFENNDEITSRSPLKKPLGLQGGIPKSHFYYLLI